MRLVIDCSVLLAYAMEDESHALADEAFRLAEAGQAELIAPPLLLAEACNVLVTNTRRKRLPSEAWLEALIAITQSPIDFDAGVDIVSVGRLAIKHQLTAYDATYLACALHYQAKLVTLDEALRQAAKKEKTLFSAADAR